jgi:hypothetical protein
METTDATSALSRVQSGQRVYLHGGAATPTPLIEALAIRARSLHEAVLALCE